MNYDLTEIPSSYDSARDHGPEFIALWMSALERYLRGARTILDLGCGTGRFSYPLSTHFDADVIAVDPSTKMLAFHHLTDRARAARECRRVLRKNGSICVRNSTRERIDSYPQVPFFPSMPAKLVALLPDRHGLCQPFEAAGLAVLTETVIRQTIAPNWVVLADKVAAGGDSVLATLPPEEFAAGIATLRRFARDRSDEAIVEPIDLFVFG